MHFVSFCFGVLLLASVQIQDGYKDLPSPTFGHLTRAENELKPQERRYLRDLNSRFDNLWEYFGEAERERRKLATAAPATGQISDVKKEYSAALNQIANSANGLRHKMVPLLAGFETHKTLNWTPIEGPAAEPFRAEMEFIRSNLREAEHRFLERFTKGIEHTEGENMLIRLYWVAKMAQQLRRELGS